MLQQNFQAHEDQDGTATISALFLYFRPKTLPTFRPTRRE